MPTALNAGAAPPGVVFWFRQDWRLHDAPALRAAFDRALQLGTWCLPVAVQDPADQAPTVWGFPRCSPHRLAWQAQAMQDVAEQLHAQGQTLWIAQGEPVATLCGLLQHLGPAVLFTQDIAAPEEQDQVQALRQAGVSVHTVWQSSLLDPQALPCAPHEVPDTFTTLRRALEARGLSFTAPVPAPVHWPAPPACEPPSGWQPWHPALFEQLSSAPSGDHTDATWAWGVSPQTHGGERAALAAVQAYAASEKPLHYHATRNGLMGPAYSTKWSPWLATGALSARQAWAAMAEVERAHGRTEGTQALWYELLWRDHFRWLHHKHGRRLYRARGLREGPAPAHNAQGFARWCRAQTGHPFIDAGLRELVTTGYLSNRLRQNVASVLVHDLGGDWRAGAAWFESHLLDYDVYSNQGNWLYLSGRGTDPRGPRRFDPDRQARLYDPDGVYTRHWSA